MATAGLPATITVEFGFGSAPDAVSLTWTDVSAYVDLGPGLTITPGRTADRSSISPRRLSITLDNRDGRFNPRNTGGPYYGNLVPRVPVRVRATYSSTTYTLFRGFVDGGWPQDFMRQARTVPITAVDAVGWAATAPPPRSAYEGEVTRLREIEGATLLGWLRPQSDGTWRDLVSGHNFPNSSVFSRQDAGDALVDGDEEGGWATDTTGYAWDKSVGVLNAPTFESPSGGLVVWWQELTAADVACCLFDLSVGASRVRVGFGWEYYNWLDIQVYQTGSGNGSNTTISTLNGGDPQGYTRARMVDGEPHMVAFYRQSYNDYGDVWVDGTEVVETSTLNIAGSNPSNDWCIINEHNGTLDSYTTDQNRWSGKLDHVMWWSNVDSWPITPTEAVTRLFEAGRLARAGDSMDARMAWILGASGWGLLGALDASQIVTQQGYRRRNTVLELLQTIEDTEQGRIWVDREGRFRFSARSWPTADTVSNAVQATFGDTGTDLPYSAAMSRIVDDDRVVVNVAEVTREYGTMQRAENAASIAAYGRRSPLGLSNLLYANDRQSRAVADWMVTAHGEPQARVEVLTFQPVNEAATLVPLACQIEPGWLIRVKRDGYTFDAHVVDVGMRIGMATWDVSLNLDATRATDLTGFTWDDGTGTVGTPWDDGTGTTSGAKGWVF